MIAIYSFIEKEQSCCTNQSWKPPSCASLDHGGGGGTKCH